MSIVKIENLRKSYYISDKGVPILWDLNLEIGEGEIVSVEGSSGVGKSTLLNILGAMDEFDHADTFTNRSVFGQRTARLAHEPHRGRIHGESPRGTNES